MPTSDDRRATLEAIAFGSDPEVKPTDRLRALELLEREEERAEEEAKGCPECAARENARLSDETAFRVLEILHELNALHGYVLDILTAATETKFGRSRVAEFLRREVFEPEALKAEIERRAQEGAYVAAEPTPEPGAGPSVEESASISE